MHKKYREISLIFSRGRNKHVSFTLGKQTCIVSKRTKKLKFHTVHQWKYLKRSFWPKFMFLSRLICISFEILSILAREFEFRASILHVKAIL